MRALLVAAAPVEGAEALVAAIASLADIVMAVDGGGALCLQAGVTPDVVVGDFDSLDEASEESLIRAGSRVVRFDPHKDESDLDLALTEARRLGVRDVTITGALAGRIDHTLATLASAVRHADLRPAFVEPELAGWVLAEGARESLELRGAGATVSVFAFGGTATVTERGLEWPLTEASLDPASTLGLSNRIGVEGEGHIAVTKGRIVVLSVAEGGSGPAHAV